MQNLGKPGGSALWTEKQQAALDTMNAIGTTAEQGLYEALAGAFGGRDGFIGLGCKPGKGGGGDLDWTVEPGWGMITLSGGDFEPDFTPIFVSAQLTGTLGAHDPADPRIDIISLAPASVDDITSSQAIFVPPASFVPTDIETRRRRFHSVTVTAGTPAPVPVAPATPAGHLLVGQFAVPATSGPLTFSDSRQLTGLSSEADQHRPWKAAPTSLAAKAGNARVLSLTVRSLEGSSYTAPEGWPADNDQRYYLRARVYDDNHDTDSTKYQIQAPGGGAVNVTAINKGEMIVKLGAGDGTFSLTIFDATTVYTGNLYLDLTPVLYYDAALAERGKGGVSATIEMSWA